MTDPNYPPANQAPYENQPGQYQAASPAPAGTQTGYRHGSGMAVAALILGILAVITSFTVFGGVVLGLLAVILGFIASGRAKRGEAPGRGMAITGIITGAIGIIIVIALIAVGVSFLNSSKFKNLQDCLQNAGNDQTKVQQCEKDYKNK